MNWHFGKYLSPETGGGTGGDAGDPTSDDDQGAPPVPPKTPAPAGDKRDAKPNSNGKLSPKEQQFREERNTARQQLKEMKTAVDTLNEKFEAAETARKKAEVDALKVKAGAKHGLPENLVDRLRGETAEEIEADAKSVADALPKPGAKPNTPPPASPANPAAAPKLTKEDVKKMTPDQINARWDEVSKVLAEP